MQPFRHRILLVDDDPGARERITADLERGLRDVRVVPVTDRRGLAEELEAPPDAVVTESHLGWTDVLAVVHGVKARAPACPVVMLTGGADAELVAEAMKAGLDDVVGKAPDQYVRLVPAVRALLLRAADRRRAQESEERFRLLVEGVRDYALILLDAGGVVVAWNPGAERVHGYREDEILGQHFSVFFTPEDRAAGVPERELETAARRGRMDDTRELTRRGGERFWAEGVTTPLPGPDRGLRGFAKVTRDITERVMAEHERLRLFEREQAAGRAKDEFLALVSHELRTPLSAIFGWVRLLRDGRLDDGATRRAVETIARNAEAQKQVIDDLLDVSHLVTGRLRLTVETVDPAVIVTAAVETLRPAAEARGLRVETALDPAAGRVRGDADRLHQVVWNLLSNAVKFTDPGGRVEVRVDREDPCVRIAVADTGRGIPPALLERMFERFTQADASPTRAHGGLGLGLAIVRYLVELHGGSVEAASPGAGHGSVFTVRLPRILPA